MINYGVANNFKKLFIIALEYPELSSNLSWFNVYLKSRSVSYINTMKNMYKEFVDMCEKNNIKCNLIEALAHYGTFNYQELLHPRLKDKIEIPYQLDITNVLSPELLDKAPKFKGEDEPRQSFESYSYVSNQKHRQDGEIIPLEDYNHLNTFPFVKVRYNKPMRRKYRKGPLF